MLRSFSRARFLRQIGNIQAAAGVTTYTIAGTVTDGVDPVAGVLVTLGAVSDTTGVDGTFELTVAAGASGDLTPTLTNGTFTPATITVSAMSGNLTGKDFIGTTLLYGLARYWNLNEISAGSAPVARLDSVAADSLTDAADAPSAAGVVGNGVGLTAASSQYLYMNDNADISVGDIDFTLMAWVKPATFPSKSGIVAHYDSTKINYVLDLNSKQARFQVGDGASTVKGTVTASTFGDMSAGQKYMIVAWHDSVANKVYVQVNNAQINEAATSGAVGDCDAVFSIGGYKLSGTMTRFADGVIDEVGLWKRTLTVAEITALYNGGNGNSHPFNFTTPTINIVSPVAYQVFQRNGSNQANISISGTYSGSPSPTAIEASFNGGAWATIDAAPANGSFSGILSNQAAGQGILTLRYTNANYVTSNLSNVGIGDIFIVTGQSNALGYGNNSQSYSHATLKAGLFGNDYVWKNLIDPTDSIVNQVDAVSLDGSVGGSIWPLIATSYLASVGIPCAFVPCAKGSTSVEDWLPGANHLDRTTLYGSMNYRISVVGGCKAVLFWQGERDARDGTAEAIYNSRLDTLANAIYADTGSKIMVAELHLLDNAYALLANQAAIRSAQTTAWGDNTNVLTGPDLSAIEADSDGRHLLLDAKLAAAAAAWWAAFQTEWGWS